MRHKQRSKTKVAQQQPTVATRTVTRFANGGCKVTMENIATYIADPGEEHCDQCRQSQRRLRHDSRRQKQRRTSRRRSRWRKMEYVMPKMKRKSDESRNRSRDNYRGAESPEGRRTVDRRRRLYDKVRRVIAGEANRVVAGEANGSLRWRRKPSSRCCLVVAVEETTTSH
ncbi:hypothetical protein H6P81_006808 [Aristolochia fimbriata]|uniref:Uncharacterized protein n=1 Tax=Aristolochia fimbriata TaxID=158543 RepID=A0AAV7EZI0_ARIFI|nr:hypothetical protein H6P81_006808 [Aristolochia fimbriata]